MGNLQTQNYFMSVKLSSQQIDRILLLAEKLQNPRRKAPSSAFAKRIEPIIKSPEGKNFLIRLMDVAFRSKNYGRISAYVLNLFKNDTAYEQLFNSGEKTLIRLFKIMGYRLPSVSIPLMLHQIQEVTSPVLFFWGDKRYKNHYHKRKKEGIQLNINLIGEALIGETEAQHRIESYCALLNQNEVDYISIKISTIYSQIESIAHDEVVAILKEKLAILYREVQKIEQKTGIQKFVNLDMEEYRDLSITLDTFKETLDQPEFKSLRAGIVLQAYLPDSYNELLSLQKWALERVQNGGSPVKVRVVKGANLEMELTEASMRDWSLATYHSKMEADANFKRMLRVLLDAKSTQGLHVGVASHNIFDLAFALTLVKDNQLEKTVDFEMLEGVSGTTPLHIIEYKVNVLLYTPIVKKENYNNAIAYLVRRLDEGTQKGNFLKEGFNLDIGSDKWGELKNQFLESVGIMETVQKTSNRLQDRKTQSIVVQDHFENVADTDWTSHANRAWITEIKQRWTNPIAVVGDTIPVVGVIENTSRTKITLKNWKGTLPWSYEIADNDDYNTMIQSNSEWYRFSSELKASILRQAACEIEKERGNLIAVAVEELGKTVVEVDVEVSEAIDFANYYAKSLLDIEKEGIPFECSGINLVLSPWNFPIAIPIGGVLASLAAGKRVILKPSQNAAACSYLISQCLWKAGVPKDAFAFLPTKESNLDPYLSNGNTFDAVILTGGTATAQFLLNRNPKLNLYAETGGKNATIVTALSDRDQAIKNVVQSAFGNTGQKCSATSLLILEREVFEDAHFKALLKDAAESRVYGDPWNFHTHIGPLAEPINDRIQHVLDTTKDHEWLLKPEVKGEFLLTPGIKWGIDTSDFGYNNELFGPILFVMKAEGIYDAIRLVNDVDYGLTTGIESLDKEEVNYWKKNIQAGNLYANRSTTGAIVQRQPFGGIKASCYGFGMKAGGVNYVRQFLNIKPQAINIDDIEEQYLEVFLSHFNKETDYVKIRGQHNICKYIRPKKVFVLTDKQTDPIHLQMVTIASQILNIEPKIVSDWKTILSEVDSNCVVRSLAASLDDDFRKALHQKHIHIYDRTPNANGRFEFLNYLTEQSLSINYHRYGNRMGEESK